MCIHCYTARIWMLHIIFCMRQSVKNCACACINIKCSFALHIFFRCCSSLLCRLFFLSSSVLFFSPYFYAIFFSRVLNLIASHLLESCIRSLHTAFGWYHTYKIWAEQNSTRKHTHTVARTLQRNSQLAICVYREIESEQTSERASE